MKANLRLNIARVSQVDYVEDGTGSVDLGHLQDGNDGVMDDVHVWRDETSADVVHLFVEHSDVGGLGYLLPVHPGYAYQAFSLSVYDRSDLTVAHEVGHNLSLKHDRHTYPDGAPDTSYEHGYINRQGLNDTSDQSRRWRTVMAYSRACTALGISCPTLPRFSNAQQSYLGDPLGIPAGNGETGTEGPADASRALNEARTVAACFRPGPADLTIRNRRGPETLRPGAAFVLTSRIRNRCPHADTGQMTLILYRSSVPSIGNNDYQVDGTVLDPIRRSEEIEWTFRTEVPRNPGTHYYGICVQPFGSGPQGAIHCTSGERVVVDPDSSMSVVGTETYPLDENSHWTSDTPVVRNSVGTVRWSTSGEDADRFDIDERSGILSMPPRDYESPEDADGDNVYRVNLRATDSDRQMADLRIAVHVLDLDESNPPGSGNGGGSPDAPNTPPVVERQIGNQALDAGETLDLDIYQSFYDRNERSLAYSVQSANPTVAVVAVDRQGLLTISGAGGGTTSVTVTAIDDEGARVSQRFRVRVRGPILVPLFPQASDPVREGFVRIVNHSTEGGEVTVEAIDDRGMRAGPAVLTLEGGAAAHFNSQDLENGNAAKGLPSGVGRGEGDWRLSFESRLDIEVLSYVRTADGFLTSMRGVAPMTDGVRRIATFNPGTNPNQVSSLRLVNPAAETAAVTIEGIDDAGVSPGTGVQLDVPPGQARTLTAADLESGAGVRGALGDGSGKWRLTVSARSPIVAMSLLESPTGHLTNLSTVSPTPVRPVAPEPVDEHRHFVPLFPSASDPLNREGVVRVTNHSAETANLRIQAYDEDEVNYDEVTLTLEPGSTVNFNSNDLELGHPGKGLSGSTGPGSGDRWLALSSASHIDVLSYIRTADGFLTAMHDVASSIDDERWVSVFNPGSNSNQRSLLRLVNPETEDAVVTISGIDDGGLSPGTAVRLRLPGRSSRTISAVELESGNDTFDGAIGDGTGKWRLWVSSRQRIIVMSLLSSPTGHLTNLSAGDGRP